MVDNTCVMWGWDVSAGGRAAEVAPVAVAICCQSQLLSVFLSDLQLEEQKMTANRQFQAEYRKLAPGLPVRFAEEQSSYQTAHP